MIESGRAKYTYSKMHGRMAHRAHALLRVQPALLVDEHRLARRHIAHQLEGQDIERDVLRGQHVFGAARRAPLAEHQRPDAVGIAEPEHAVADHHHHHRVAAAAAPVHRAGGRENVGRRHALRANALQLRGQHVEQHFGIGLAVEVAPLFAREHFGQFRGIGEVAVVAQADAVGSIDVERLGLGGAVAAGGRVADMPDSRVAAQFEHVVLLEHVAHQAGTLAHAQRAVVGGHDAGGILAAVLQHGERVVDALVYCTRADDADDATHSC